MTSRRAWWQRRRVKHRDAVVLCVLSSAFLLAGELTAPLLRDIWAKHLTPYLVNPPEFVLRATLALFAFTTAFGAVLVLTGGWFFLRGNIPRGRFLVGLGVGVTGLSLVSKLAYWTLVSGAPWTYLWTLASTLTGIGVLLGVGAHMAMGRYALVLKKRVGAVWRRWRRPRRTARRLL